MIEPRFTTNFDGTYAVRHNCDVCGRTVDGQVQASDVFAWRQGAFVQDAFYYVPPAIREALFVSGVCPDCWDKMFLDLPDYM